MVLGSIAYPEPEVSGTRAQRPTSAESSKWKAPKALRNVDDNLIMIAEDESQKTTIGNELRTVRREELLHICKPFTAIFVPNSASPFQLANNAASLYNYSISKSQSVKGSRLRVTRMKEISELWVML